MGSSTGRGLGLGLAERVELVDLSDEIGAEALVALFADQREAALEIDVTSGGEWVIGPQASTLIPGGARELERAVEEAGAEAVTSSVGVDEQDP